MSGPVNTIEPRYRAIWGGGEETTGLGSILPVGVVAIEAVGAVTPDMLFPGEHTFVAKAVESRRIEFARGRSCARRALAMLGTEPSPVLCDDNRAPLWPPGVVGSITHCLDYCASVVARADRWSSIGIDAEVLRSLGAGVERRIVLPAERRHLDELDPAIPWECVVFSVKEAFYKAWFPLTRRWLDFLDVEVHLDPSRGRFQATLRVDEPRFSSPGPIEGSFCIDGPRVLGAIVLPPYVQDPG
jgi:4'-phosphopantetheinyl transferase EntD